MRRMLYVLLLGALLFVPLERTDVAKLLPIQAVAVYLDGGLVVLETDTENIGRGTDVALALEDLKKNTPAVVYLDTAEFLLVSPDATECVELLKRYLKPSVAVCICDGAGRVKETAKYVDIHGKMTKLSRWNA